MGGGPATLPKSGDELFDFLPAGEILEVAEAILRTFHRLGDYTHKQRNRMKFLIRGLGFAAWRAEFDRALADVRAEGKIPLAFDPEAPPLEAPPDWPRLAPPSVAEAAARAASAQVRGPGIVPELASMPFRPKFPPAVAGK